MKGIKYHFVLVSIFILISCSDELEIDSYSVQNSNSQHSVNVEKTVKNGRFVFSSKESLEKTAEKLNNQNPKDVEKEFEELYEKGFRSHKPIISSNNEELQAKLSEEYKQKNNLLKSEGIEEEEFIIDPIFASLVNKNNEIIVNDTLYKFTQEKGLFFVHIKDSTYLQNYFGQVLNKEKELGIKSFLSNRLAPCKERESYGGVTRIDDKISRYISPIDDNCYGGGGGSGTSGGNVTSSLSEDEKLQKIISNLPICQGKDNWFQNLFGKSYYCINYFDSKHRIKTEFWDQKWLIYASAGIQVKTQRKRLGIWWKSDSDEIHLGINKVFLKYKILEPKINTYKYSQTYTTSLSGGFPIYMYNYNYYTYYQQGKSYIPTVVDVVKNELPFFDYDDDKILNIYIPRVPIIKEIDLNLTTGNTIYTESNIKSLYKMGIDFLKKLVVQKENL